MILGLSPPFLHTTSNQKSDDWKAWERGWQDDTNAEDGHATAVQGFAVSLQH